MNRTTINFYLRRTVSERHVFTEDIIILLMACIRHAIATGTKDAENPDLGASGADLVRAVKEAYKLEVAGDAMDNVRSMVNKYELRHFAPLVSETDKEIATHVLRTLHTHGPLSKWVSDDVICMIDDFGN